MSEADPRAEPAEEHISENVTECPGCWDTGEKTGRVGTYKCTTGSCRVHFYQEGFRET